jgi:hypothetical protein
MYTKLFISSVALHGRETLSFTLKVKHRFWTFRTEWWGGIYEVEMKENWTLEKTA